MDYDDDGRKSFEEFINSAFPEDRKRNRSAIIRRNLEQRIIRHLKGNIDEEKTFRHYVKKTGFSLLNLPAAGVRDELVVTIKKEKQNENDRTIMKGHRKVAVVEDFFTIIKQVRDIDCLHAGSKKNICSNSEFVFKSSKKCC